jgi:hypothetical protein
MGCRNLCNVLVVKTIFVIVAFRVEYCRLALRRHLGFFRISSSTSSKARTHRACTGKPSSPLYVPRILIVVVAL